MTRRGRLQAVEAARSLRESIPDLARGRACPQILSSPLDRAGQTARIIADLLGAERVEIDDALRETAFGDWEGLTSIEVKQRFPEQRRRRKADRWNYAPPDGESPAELADRMRVFLNARAAAPAAILVTHSGNIRALAHLAAAMPVDEALALPVALGSVWRWDGDRFDRIAP